MVGRARAHTPAGKTDAHAAAEELSVVSPDNAGCGIHRAAGPGAEVAPGQELLALDQGGELGRRGLCGQPIATNLRRRRLPGRVGRAVRGRDALQGCTKLNIERGEGRA